MQRHCPAKDQQRELGLQYRRGLWGEPRPAALFHQNHCSWDTCSLWWTPQVSWTQFDSALVSFPQSYLPDSTMTACVSLQVRGWDCSCERSHNSGNEQFVAHPNAQAAEEQGHAHCGVLAWKSSVAKCTLSFLSHTHTHFAVFSCVLDSFSYVAFWLHSR